MLLLAFLLAVYLLPVVVAGVALLTGISARAGERRFLVCSVPAVLLSVGAVQVQASDQSSGYAVHLLACAAAAVAGTLVAVGKSVVALWRPPPPRDERQARRTASDDTRLGRSLRRAVVRTQRQRRGAWATPARRLVLSRPDGAWRYAVENDDRVVNGGLPELGRESAPSAAQQALLAHVERETGLRYDAVWRTARPGWWTAELTVTRG